MPKKLAIVLLVLVFSSGLIFLANQGRLIPSYNFIGNISKPVNLVFSDFTYRTKGFFGGFLNLSKLQQENSGLKHTNNRLQAEVAQLKEFEKENKKLRAELNFVSSNNYSYEAAEVTNIEPSAFRGALTVNKGSKNGIGVNMAVISEGFLVGRVTEVYDNFSKIILITDPSSVIPTSLQQANASGLAKGEIGFGVVMDKIPQSDNIREGDTVITSGLGGELPRGLILGYISKINKKENSLFKTANIRPATNLNNLNQIIIIKNQ